MYKLKYKKGLAIVAKPFDMETAGFEPASRGPDTDLSTCVVYH